MSRRLAASLCALALLALSPLRGDTIVLFGNGTPTRIDDVRILGMKDGYLLFERGEQKAQIELLKVQSVIPKVEPPYLAVERFAPVTVATAKGMALSFALREKAERIKSPFIRVFALEERDHGVRALRLFTNLTNEDPTATWRLPEINTDAFAGKAFFVTMSEAVAWRIEGWVNGKLVCEREIRNSETIEADWWRERPGMAVLLRDLPAEKIVKKDEKPADQPPPVQVEVGETRFREEADNKGNTTYFRLGYVLKATDPDLESVEAPTATLYYVTEDGHDQRNVGSLRLPMPKGQQKLVKASFKYSDEAKLPGKVYLGARGFEQDKGTNIERLVYWRVELRYGKTVVAEQEAPNAKVKGSLPANWWESTAPKTGAPKYTTKPAN